LAVASLLATNPEKVMAVGKNDGVYVVPAVIDRTWLEDIRGSVGISVGSPMPQDQSNYAVRLTAELVMTAKSSATLKQTSGGQEGPDQEEYDEAEKGEDAVLILNDDGGVWMKHNSWLKGLDSPVCVQAHDGIKELIQLKVSNRPDGTQWVMQDNARLSIRHLVDPRGYENMKLTKSCACSIKVTILNLGEKPTSHLGDQV